MIAAYQVTQAIHVAAVLGIADLLKDGPRDGDLLAQLADVNPDGLYRLLRALAGVGIFAEVEPRRFALTPLAEPLRTDVPDSVHAFAALQGQPWIWRPWGRLLDAVKTGNSVFPDEYGMPFFDYFTRNEQARTVLQAALAGSGRRTGLADHYDFSQSSTVADIAGGQGALLGTILSKYQHLRGIVFDRSVVLAHARQHLTEVGLIDRCDLVGGDFFESVVVGADTYLLSQVLHDWNDNAALTILTNCRRAMPEHGRLLAIERILPERQAPIRGPLGDLNMLVLMNGRERTRDEYEALLAKADLRLAQVSEMGDGFSVIEAVPRT